ncbi:MAG: hypothetical protein KIT60_16490 [Burkholderiaceae bacterium]|nr:hypothetical protein [Burkholderiaceae bacterium]
MPAATARNGKSATARKSGPNPLKKWASKLFSRPLKLKRIGWQLHVVFAETKLQPPSSRGSSRGEALRMAHEALQALLARHEDARQVVPHLRHLEQALARIGSRALIELPDKVLQRAMDQLDMLEGARRSDEIMPLRVRIDEALRRRAPVNLRGDIANIDVQEASESQYQEAEVSWTHRMELDAIYAQVTGNGALTTTK